MTWSVAGAAISRGFQLAAIIVTARILGSNAFGKLAVVQTTVGLVASFAGLGLAITATKYISESRDRDRTATGRVLGMAIGGAAFSAAGFSVLLFVTANWVASELLRAPELVIPLKLSAGLVFLSAISGAQSGALTGFEAFGKLAALNLARGLVGGAGAVSGAYLSGVGGATVGLACGELAAVVVGGQMLRGEMRRHGVAIHWPTVLEERRIFWQFSLPALAGSSAIYPALWWTQVLLARSPGGFTETGIFAAAYKWHLLILFLPSSVGQSVLPMLGNLRASRDADGFRRIYGSFLLLCLAVTVPAAIIVSLLSEPIMGLNGPSFGGGWLTLAVLAVATVPMSLNTVLSQLAISLGKIRIWVISDLLLAAALVVAATFLVPRWQSGGLAASHLVAYVATCFALLSVTTRVANRSEEPLLDAEPAPAK